MILIAVLPYFLPMNALVPVHGLTQMSSNLSRAVFGYKDVKLEVIPKFLFGSILGVSFFCDDFIFYIFGLCSFIYRSIYSFIYVE